VTQISLNTWCQDDCTIGRLSVDGIHCFTLELPWKLNMPQVSCIPPGEYRVTKYQSPSKGLCLLLHDVPHRSMIEIHAGNYTSQIEGCILVGDSVRYLDADTIPDVTNSKTTLARLIEYLPQESSIKINRAMSLTSQSGVV